MSRFVFQVKDVFGRWHDGPDNPTIEQAAKAWSLWSKGSKRETRCVERTETAIDISAVLAAHLKGGK